MKIATCNEKIRAEGFQLRKILKIVDGIIYLINSCALMGYLDDKGLISLITDNIQLLCIHL